MVDVSEDVWDALVDVRQSRPLLAGRKDGAARAAVLQAALRQAEELFRAAAAVGLASRPMLLYYGATQAARALAACSSPDPFALHRHGVGTSDWGRLVPDAAARDVPVIVRCHPSTRTGERTLFGGLLESLGLPLPDNGTVIKLGEAWSPLVDRALQRPLDGSVLLFGPRVGLGWTASQRHATSGAMKQGVAFSPRGESIPKKPYKPRQLTRYVRENYPGVRDAIWVEDPPIDARLHFSLDLTSYPLAHGESPRHDDWYVCPLGLPQLASALPAWWVVLFVCGSLARYEPARWGAMIDEDHSPDGAALREAMRVAVNDVPRHFLRVFTASSWLASAAETAAHS